MHVFASLIPVADVRLAGAFQEQKLANTFIGVDLGRQRRGVADFDRHLPLPLRLQRRHIHDDPAACVGGFAQADHQHVARDAEILHRMPEREAVGRDDADVHLAVDEAGGREGLGVDHRRVDIGEYLEDNEADLDPNPGHPQENEFGTLADGAVTLTEKHRATAKRDDIAQAMWDDYQRVLLSRG